MRTILSGTPLVTAVLLCVLGTSPARAVPSDAQVIRDISAPGVISIKLRGNGSRVWSEAYKQYMWDRSATVIRKAGIPEFPNARLEVGGIATYSIVGGSFVFSRFLVSYNSYTGIPAPSAKVVLALCNGKLPDILGNAYHSIVGDVQPLALASDPQWDWHTPNSVSVRVTTGYQRKINNTQMEKDKAVITVRLYRDAIKKPWTRITSTDNKETALATSTHDADDLAAMKTLQVVDAERQAGAHLANLPGGAVPEFASDLELFAYLHKTFRESDAATAEAVLRRCLAPRFFQPNSTVLLDNIGEDLVQSTIKAVYGRKITYAEQYPADLNVSAYQPNLLTFMNADGQHISRMSAVAAGGEYQNGVKVGQSFKIQDLSISAITDADEIARLRSMTPAQRFAPPPGSTPFSQLGGQVAAQQTAANNAAVVQAIKWTPFTSTNARLTLAFPAPPKETQGQMNGQYPMWTVEAQNDQVLCRAVAVIYPKSLSRMQAQTTVQSALDSLARSNGATVKDQSERNAGTYGTMATLEKDGVVMKVQVFAIRDVLYQLLLSGSPATMASLSDREFFNSFQALR